MAIIKIETATRRIRDFSADLTVFPIPASAALGESVVTQASLPANIEIGKILSQDGQSVSDYDPPAQSLADRRAAVKTRIREIYDEADRDFQQVLVWERTDGATIQIGTAQNPPSATWPEIIIRSWWKPWTAYMINRVERADAFLSESRVSSAEVALGLYSREFSAVNGGLGMETWYGAADRQTWATVAEPGTNVYITDAANGRFTGGAQFVVSYPSGATVADWGMRAAVLTATE